VPQGEAHYTGPASHQVGNDDLWLTPQRGTYVRRYGTPIKCLTPVKQLTMVRHTPQERSERFGAREHNAAANRVSWLSKIPVVATITNFTSVWHAPAGRESKQRAVRGAGRSATSVRILHPKPGQERAAYRAKRTKSRNASDCRQWAAARVGPALSAN